MSQAQESELDPTALEIYDLLRRQPGDRFTAEDIAAQLDYGVAQVEPHLGRLVQRGLIEQTSVEGKTAYILSSAAPEL